MKILLVGNCQAEEIGKLLAVMATRHEVEVVRLLPSAVPALLSGTLRSSEIMAPHSGERLPALCRKSDLILLQHSAHLARLFETDFPEVMVKTRYFPRIIFRAFHPDMVYIPSQVLSPTGALHSSIACYGWLRGLSAEDTISLFRQEIFERLGFFEHLESSIRFLFDDGRASMLPLEALVDRWMEQGVWMHTINHPKLHVLADLARAILYREGITYLPDAVRGMEDRLERIVVWSVYPEIAKHLGVEGEYRFLCPKPRLVPRRAFDLEQFVRESYRMYAGYPPEDLACDRVTTSRFRELDRYLEAGKSESRSRNSAVDLDGNGVPGVRGHNPYHGLPDHCFWRRAVERVPMADLDPVIQAEFRLGRDDRIATAGSCFAQHISYALALHGFNYHVTERGEEFVREEAARRHYGVFSARYGNLYTARQLLQLFDRAYGDFVPMDCVWVREDGRLADAFRPQIEPEGFASLELLDQSRNEHLCAVRELFETLDVLVFTLGLTEAWQNRIDGAVYPLAPGVAGGEMDRRRYEFVNFDVGQIVSDMQSFIDRLVRVNPRARIILTVSPVPLIATYEDRHVIVSNTYSKSVLRVAAEMLTRRNPICTYFPSYEIITGLHARGDYFESDLRSVNTKGVEHVMRVFFRHYLSEVLPAASFEQELMSEHARISGIICDEEVIED